MNLGRLLREGKNTLGTDVEAGAPVAARCAAQPAQSGPEAPIPSLAPRGAHFFAGPREPRLNFAAVARR